MKSILLAVFAFTAVFALQGCGGNREVKYQDPQWPTAAADNLTLTLEHFQQEKDLVRFRVNLKNGANQPVLIPLKNHQTKGDGDSFVVKANGHEYHDATVSNKLPKGQNKWARALGNFNVIKNASEAQLTDQTTVPASGQAEIELTFTLDPKLPRGDTPWTLTLSGAKRGSQAIAPLTVEAK